MCACKTATPAALEDRVCQWGYTHHSCRFDACCWHSPAVGREVRGMKSRPRADVQERAVSGVTFEPHTPHMVCVHNRRDAFGLQT